MWSKRFFFLGVMVGGLVSLLFLSFAQADERAIDHCVAEYDAENREIDCLYALIEERMRSQSIAEAFRLFQKVYERSSVFSSSGCHRHAHKVGDMAYYQFYVPTKDIASLELGGETGACGYGFFHGLMEHLTQENPDPRFVRTICEYLDKTLGSELSDIRPICYHGSGHGFMLRHVEELPVDAWGDTQRFVEGPLEKCAALEGVTEREREECEEGVYNIIVDWMVTDQFGFSYDYDKPFTQCDLSREFSQKRACYYETAMKLTVPAGKSPSKLLTLISGIDHAELRHSVFRVGVAGMIQSVAGTDRYDEMLDECLSLDAEYMAACVESVLHGLFEHGTPTEEYKKPLRTCKTDRMRDAQLTDHCYSFVMARLPRFYDEARRRGICAEFPDPYRTECLR